jgi:hypothetical protein
MSPNNRSTPSSNSELVGSSISRRRAFMLRTRAMASSLPLRDGKQSRQLVDAAGETHLIEERTAECFHPPETRQAPLAEEEVPDDHVFPGGQVREQVELLVDNGDAQPLRIERSVNGGRLPVEEEAPAIGPDGAGDDPGERALARAVFAHERVDFSRAHFQAGASQRRQAAETFAGIRDFQKGMGHQCYSLTPSRPPGTLV